MPDHDHSTPNAQTVSEEERNQSRARMRAALAVTATFLLIEVVGGWISGSLALLADAGHMFTDVAALLLAYSAMTLAQRGPTQRYTFGLHRAEILAAFVNAQLLLVIGGFVLWEAYERFRDPVEIDTGLMLIVAIVGLVANIISASFLHGHHESSLNVRAAYLEVVTDALGSVAVIFAALAIRYAGWTWTDPLVSVGIALFILPRAWSILREAAHVLLEGTPQNVDLGEVRRELGELPGVVEIHDFHCWTLTSGVNSASVHVRVVPESERFALRREVEKLIQDRVGIDHVTVQVEESMEECCGPRH